jgi:glucose/arabinose dehydrogenase
VGALARGSIGPVRGWVTAVVAVIVATTALPSAASGAALVPLAPASAWPSDPIHATAPPGDPRLFVAERGGAVRIVEDGVLRPTPFLTVPNVDVSGERGLLSLAFAPSYASNGLLYVFTVAKGAGEFGAEPGDLQVVEYRRSLADPNLADPASARLVLGIPHSAGNHNGGQLAFGTDGLLYLTVGDNANSANAQELGNLYGKVLRVDPSPTSGTGYEIPPTNPFVGAVGAKGEIYALGLRNPYRASFAPDGRLVVADVGSGLWEEVNAGDLAGANLGWPTCEGACLSPNPTFTNPFFQYPNQMSNPGPGGTTGCAIIGGHVVRDGTLSGLTGRYLYGDLCRTDLRTIDLDAAGGNPQPAGLSLPSGGLRGFGEDSGCRLYVLTDQTVYRIASDTGTTLATDGGPVCGPTRVVISRKRFSLRVRAPRRQRLRGHVKAVAICSEDCALRARGHLLFFKGGRKAGSARLIPVSRPAKANRRSRFRLAVLKVRVRQRAKRLLKRGRRVFARVTVVAFDGEGNRVSRHARVRLIR